MKQVSRELARKRRRRRIWRNRLIFVLTLLVILIAITYGAYRLIELYKISHMPSQSLQAIQESGMESDEQWEGTQALEQADYTSSQNDWRLILVNANVKMPENYTIETAVADESTGKYLQTEAASAYRQMALTALADGVELVLCSGYRSIDYQQKLWDTTTEMNVLNGLSQEEAESRTRAALAVPGYSEHNTGLAADVVSIDYQMLDAGFDKTNCYVWLSEHAAEYGFILRYPENKSEITGISYEPWHYRYVGKENAIAIWQSGKCLEEYLASIEIVQVNSEQSLY